VFRGCVFITFSCCTSSFGLPHAASSQVQIRFPHPRAGYRLRRGCGLTVSTGTLQSRRTRSRHACPSSYGVRRCAPCVAMTIRSIPSACAKLVISSAGIPLRTLKRQPVPAGDIGADELPSDSRASSSVFGWEDESLAVRSSFPSSTKSSRSSKYTASPEMSHTPSLRARTATGPS